MISTEKIEKIKLYMSTIAACAIVVGMIATPISLWALSSIASQAKAALQMHGPEIITKITNKQFEEVYLAGFRELDERNKGIESRQLEFQHKLERYKEGSKSDHNLTHERIKGIDSKVDLLINQMRRDNRRRSRRR